MDRLRLRRAVILIAAALIVLIAALLVVQLVGDSSSDDANVEITMESGSIQGLATGRGVGPDEVIEAITPELGEADLDTGWVDVNTDVRPCPELTEYRELWWGDLSFGFWGTGDATYLHFWNVGDRRAVLFSVPDLDQGAPGPPLDLMTDQGIHIGDDVTTIPPPFAARASAAGDERFESGAQVVVVSADPATVENSGHYLGVDGTVVSFGAESFAC
ncbi:hypothetical protein [Ilumatobacter nonamiensis]|uniref:hypothetical protein n=1 Tax=Ilumatobacter nonamiensis TaxID=467093 RepID=UPI000346A8EC|nr:hypothetical protein [Ilumatobacter nonamiensis]